MMFNRVLFKDGSSLNDISKNTTRLVSDSSTVTIESSDNLYIGSVAPFNNVFLKFGSTKNSNASAISIKYWNGGEWVDAVDVIDETDVAGACFAKDGHINWTVDISKTWQRDHTKEGSTVKITDLGDITIYDMFWIKVSFSSDLTASVNLNYVGQIFSDDEDLESEFPDLNRTNLKNAFQQNKTDWQEQHKKASDLIIKDLISRNIINHPGQILKREQFRMACVSKTAEIIFNAFGDDFKDQRDSCRKEYQARMNQGVYNVDKNSDALLDPHTESRIREGFLTR